MEPLVTSRPNDPAPAADTSVLPPPVAPIATPGWPNPSAHEPEPRPSRSPAVAVAVGAVVAVAAVGVWFVGVRGGDDQERIRWNGMQVDDPAAAIAEAETAASGLLEAAGVAADPAPSCWFVTPIDDDTAEPTVPPDSHVWCAPIRLFAGAPSDVWSNVTFTPVPTADGEPEATEASGPAVGATTVSLTDARLSAPTGMPDLATHTFWRPDGAEPQTFALPAVPVPSGAALDQDERLVPNAQELIDTFTDTYEATLATAEAQGLEVNRVDGDGCWFSATAAGAMHATPDVWCGPSAIEGEDGSTPWYVFGVRDVSAADRFWERALEPDPDRIGGPRTWLPAEARLTRPDGASLPSQLPEPPLPEWTGDVISSFDPNGIERALPASPRFNWAGMASTVSGTWTSATVDSNGQQYRAAPGNEFFAFGLTNVSGFEQAIVSIDIDGAVTNLGTADGLSDDEHWWMLHVPTGSTLRLTVSNLGLTGTYDLRAGAPEGTPPAIFYRDPTSNSVLTEAVDPFIRLVVDGRNAVYEVTEARLTGWRYVDQAYTTAELAAPGRAYLRLYIDEVDVAFYDSQRLDSLDPASLTVTLPDGTVIGGATRFGAGTGPQGLYFLDVPDTITDGTLSIAVPEVWAAASGGGQLGVQATRTSVPITFPVPG